MKIITEDNLNDFINYYHGLHDSYITNINHDIINSKIEVLINVFWSGTPILNEDNTLDTNKTNIKIVFKGIEKYNNKIISYSEITESYINFIKLGNKKFICFADDENEPQVYIVSDSMEYKEITL